MSLATEDVTFSLRPGGGAGMNPFAQFGKGAGLTLAPQGGEGGALNGSQGSNSGQRKVKKEITFRYTTTFLKKFRERYSKAPPHLQNIQLEIFVSEAEKNANQEDDSWRKDQSPKGDLPKIQTAADVGNKAWSLQHSTGMDQTLKTIRGLLNKLTPEKYDSLLVKFVDSIQNVECLSKAIPLIFEKAVAEPTFVALYAQLCQDLSQRLPDFPEEGSDKPVKFQKLLLNTCQDEYEAIEENKKKLAEATEEADKELKAKKLKQQLLGTMRLIAELYNKGLVTDVIMKVCMKDLLDGAYVKGVVSEDNVEALCEVITLAGKTMDQSKLSKLLNAWLNNMDKMTTYDNIAPRIKFLIKDVLELRKNGFKARKQKFTAKKINEIREAAQAELGIIDMQFNDTYPQSQSQMDSELFPGFREGAAPAPPKPQAPAPAPKPAPKQPEKPAAAELTEEEREQKTESLLAEYLSVADKEEAMFCINEIKQAQFMPRIVELLIKKLLDVIQSREHDLLMDLMMELVSTQVVSSNQFIEGYRRHSDMLMDLSLDVPKALQLLSKTLALVYSTKKIPLNTLSTLCVPMEDTQTQRDFTATVLKELISVQGEDDVKQQIISDGVKGGEFLEKNDEFDPPDMESAEEFLKGVGLEGVLTV
eukprot:TRINITY_DN12476_c0_g2_i1.p1 TRINITY_DN12476_c0_g2~~TRINITY_DN12476_c0_g2_i1.p1  ORF type:complete len:646 (-),score=135.80 TRINITY_DN12476_c0_g2_i1:1473-3410(-)